MGIGLLFLGWELGSQLWGSDLIFPGPLLVLKQWLLLIQTKGFLEALAYTFGRVMLGIIVSAPLSVGVGLIAGLDTRGAAFFRPFFAVIGATPVMSVILIAFLILGSERTPIFTAFLMVFPVMTANTVEGVHAVDPKLKELCKVYALSWREQVQHLYIPAITPFILGGLQSALALCWKVVVAAEVLVQPLRALGTGMQRSKAQLETPELFAWTLGTVIAAALSQCLLTLILKPRVKGV
jgi:NitT/TauT family transport system permease protein